MENGGVEDGTVNNVQQHQHRKPQHDGLTNLSIRWNESHTGRTRTRTRTRKDRIPNFRVTKNSMKMKNVLSSP
jgi:hypothetical protein